MSIRFFCRSCKKRIRVSDRAAGYSIKCPACNSRITVPDENAIQHNKKTTPASIMVPGVPSNHPCEDSAPKPVLPAGFAIEDKVLELNDLLKENPTFVN